LINKNIEDVTYNSTPTFGLTILTAEINFVGNCTPSNLLPVIYDLVPSLPSQIVNYNDSGPVDYDLIHNLVNYSDFRFDGGSSLNSSSVVYDPKPSSIVNYNDFRLE
ncbi:2719_t:CDS:2, partial [Dentiscutata heterogama]